MTWPRNLPIMPMMRVQRALLISVGVIVALAFLFGVWPTPWRYDHACGRLVRVSRFTNRVDVLLDKGWYELGTNPLDEIARQTESERRGIVIVSQIVCSPDGPTK